MITYETDSWLRLLFTFKGSVLTHIWRRVVAATAFSVVVTVMMDLDVIHALYVALIDEDAPKELLDPKQLSLTTLPFTLIGTALAIFLGFRNNSSYDRFWEGRKLWGRMINLTRTLTRQTMTLVAPERGGALDEDAAAEARAGFEHELVYRLVAYVHALRHHLRQERDFEDCRPFMPEGELDVALAAPNAPIHMLHRMGERYAEAWRAGWVETMHLPTLENSLLIITDIQGGCERIQKTPIPFAYTVLMHRIVALYCFALPLGIYTTIGDFTPIVVLIISYSFLGLDAIGQELEEPFGTEPNDLPLSAICRMLEIECRQRLGESALPEPLEAVDHKLI